MPGGRDLPHQPRPLHLLPRAVVEEVSQPRLHRRVPVPLDLVADGADYRLDQDAGAELVAVGH